MGPVYSCVRTAHQSFTLRSISACSKLKTFVVFWYILKHCLQKTSTEFSGYKIGEQVQNTLKNVINDPEPHILNTLETEKAVTDDLVLASTPKIEKVTVKNSLPQKLTRKDIPITQQENIDLKTLRPLLILI